VFDPARLLQLELSFCESFTNKAVREYGVLYFNSLNPQSHDSNHALILNTRVNLDSAIHDVVEFYRSRRITPRIYPSFISSELDLLRPYLASRGFTVQVYASVFMRVVDNRPPAVQAGISVRRISRLTDEVMELVHTDEAGDWTINVLKTHLNDGRFHLLGLFHSGRCASIASVKIMDGYSRVDDVKTHVAFRGRHFGTDLMRYLIAYHRAISSNYLYLWATNPVAIRMYKNVGFEVFEFDRPTWSAHIESTSGEKL